MNSASKSMHWMTSNAYSKRPQGRDSVKLTMLDDILPDKSRRQNHCFSKSCDLGTVRPVTDQPMSISIDRMTDREWLKINHSWPFSELESRSYGRSRGTIFYSMVRFDIHILHNHHKNHYLLPSSSPQISKTTMIIEAAGALCERSFSASIRPRKASINFVEGLSPIELTWCTGTVI